MAVNWEAVNAIGSWAAGIGTVGAVIIALRQNKPKVMVESKVMSCTQPVLVGGKWTKDNILFITITNTGLTPVNITGGGIKLPKTSLYLVPDPQYVPKILMPSEQTHIYTDWLDLQARGLKDKDLSIAWDSCGNYYYTNVNIFRRISRTLWWKYGKQPIPKKLKDD